MSQIENTLTLITTRVSQIEKQYGNYSFKKSAKKEWINLYDYHIREINFLFTAEEVNKAYEKALEALSMFCQINAKYRKK